MSVDLEIDHAIVGPWQVVFVRVGPFELRVLADETAPRDGAPVRAQAQWVVLGGEPLAQLAIGDA